jgi:hypothetical protein
MTAITWKETVRLASTGNLNVAATHAAIDGVSLLSGDRVLLKNQTISSENGIYTATAASAPFSLVRPIGETIEPEDVVRVSEGTVNAHTQWALLTQGAILVGTTSLTFVQQSPIIGSNVGGGVEVFKERADNTLHLRTLRPGRSVQLTQGEDAINIEVGGKTTKDIPDTNITLTEAEARKTIFKATGALTATRTANWPGPARDSESYERLVHHAGTGASIRVGTGTGNTVIIEPGAKALVEFNASGARAVADYVLDPRDFGCPWDGVNDDLPGLDAMISSIPASRGHRTVVQLPKGEGYCSDDWHIYRNVEIRGHGTGSIANRTPANGLKFAPLKGLILDGYYTSPDYKGGGPTTRG